MLKRIVCALTVALLSAGAAQADLFRRVPESREQVMLSFAPVVKQASPAVVNIYTKRKVVTAGGFAPLMQDPLFREFFGRQFGGLPQERVVSSLGSGVLVKADGTIVTNNHVIKDSDQIIVILNDRREFDAKVVVADPQTDLAILKIDGGGELPVIGFADSDALQVGDVVLAIGNPFGVGQTVTHGIISALARTTLGITDYQFFIQTDAPINPGNSGGALVTLDGRLAGINTAIFSRTGGSNGIGFAIPANMVRAVVEGTKDGRLQRPWLGATTQPVSPDIAESLGMARPGGVLVGRVHAGSPASAAGLQSGDVILTVNGAEVGDSQALNYRVATMAPGSAITLGVVRDGKPFEAKATLALPPETPARDARALKGNHPLSGATVANLSPAVAMELGLDPHLTGVVVTEVRPATPAAQLGIQKGDILLKVNRVDVKTAAALAKVMEARQPGWRIVFRRGRDVLTLAVSP